MYMQACDLGLNRLRLVLEHLESRLHLSSVKYTRAVVIKRVKESFEICTRGAHAKHAGDKGRKLHLAKVFFDLVERALDVGQESVKAQVRVVHDANTIDARVGQLVDPIDGAQDGDDKVNERNDQPDQVGAEHLAPRVLVDGRDALAAPAHGWAELAARVHARTPVAAAEVEQHTTSHISEHNAMLRPPGASTSRTYLDRFKMKH